VGQASKMPDSLLDDIIKALKGEKKSELINQILKEKALYDALKEAGLTIVAEDTHERAREMPYGILSKVQKIDLVDLITEITNISNIDLIDLITEITTVKNIESVDLIDLITRIALIDNITNIESIDLIDAITTIGAIDKIKEMPAQAFSPILNKGFETGDFTSWIVDPAGTGHSPTILTDTSFAGKYSAKLTDADGGIKQNFLLPIHTNCIKSASVLITCAGDIFHLGGGWLNFTKYYSDSTIEDEDLELPAEAINGDWATLELPLTANKFLVAIWLKYTSGNGEYLILDEVDFMPVTETLETEKGTVMHFSKAATSDLVTPAAGKKVKVWSAFYSCQDDIVTELRFKTSGNVVLALPTLGSVGMELKRTEILGAANEVLEIYLSGAGTVKGWISVSDE